MKTQRTTRRKSDWTYPIIFLTTGVLEMIGVVLHALGWI